MEIFDDNYYLNSCYGWCSMVDEPEKDSYLFDILKTDPRDAADQIKVAKAAILKALTEDETRPIEVLFSGGKDSLLVALLTHEVITENKIETPVKLHTDLTGYERNFGRYEKTILDAVGGVFDVDVFAPPPLFAYSVEVLGFGVQPLNSYHFRDCTKKWKTRVAPQNGFFFSGVRRAESRKRGLDYKFTVADQWFDKLGLRCLAPCVGVNNDVLWDYLRENVHKIGVDIGFVLDAYSTDVRHGCWCCFFGKDDNLPPFEREIKRLARYWGRWYLDNRAQYYKPPYREKNTRPRATLKYKKIIYDQVLDLQEKFGVDYIKPISKRLIREIWNLQETYLTRGDDDDLDPWNKISYKLFLTVQDDYIQNHALDADLVKSCFEVGYRGKQRLLQRVPLYQYRGGVKKSFEVV